MNLYLRKIPPKVFNDPESTFYWKPNDRVPLSDSAPWFTLQVMGRNTLASMVKMMFQEIGVEGKSNHSLRATGATRLFESNVPEKLIQERTGHKSVDALRLYERTSVDQQKSVSTLLCVPKKDTSALLCAPKKSEFQCPMTAQLTPCFDLSQQFSSFCYTNRVQGLQQLHLQHHFQPEMTIHHSFHQLLAKFCALVSLLLRFCMHVFTYFCCEIQFTIKAIK